MIDPFFGSLISGGASVIGGLLGRSGQQDANEWNARLAAENRAWQERMSSTAYQRSAADLKKAGLNRILAIGQPASTPAGNVARMENQNALLSQGINQGVTNALAARRLHAEIKNMNARTELIRAQRNAIAPAETVGKGTQAVTEMAQGPYRDLVDRSSRLIDEVDYRNVIDTTAHMAQKRIDDLSKMLGLNPFRTRQLLIQTVNQMDLPPMSDAEKYQWAINNPEKIKAFRDRQKRMQQ